MTDNDKAVNTIESIEDYRLLSEDFIREFQDEVDWRNISLKQKLSEDFIREFKDKVYWFGISKQKLSEDFIKEFQNKVDWCLISEFQVLSEDFIREFKDKVYWEQISRYQKLSEDFIREFEDSVYWWRISVNQVLSEGFVREFKDKIVFHRPNIIFIRDIEPLKPCISAVKKYLSIWDKDQEITWNELLSKYDNTDDICWLVRKIGNGIATMKHYNHKEKTPIQYKKELLSKFKNKKRINKNYKNKSLNNLDIKIHKETIDWYTQYKNSH